MGLVLFYLSAAPLLADQFGLFTYRVVGDTVEITDYPTTEVGGVDIPAEIDGKPVTSIGEYAFAGCDGLTSITVPEGVTILNFRAFRNCPSLITISLPSSLDVIGEEAFFGCVELISVRILGGVTTIGRYAFSDCHDLASVTIPSSVTSISNYAFRNCIALVSITIPSNVTTLSYSAFRGCSGMESFFVEAGNLQFASAEGVLFDSVRNWLVQCPARKVGAYAIAANVTTISTEAFYGCSELTSVAMPEGLIGIGTEAFYGCTGLTSVNIPSSVKSINSGAFYGCSGLTSVNIPANVSYLGSTGYQAFSGCSGLMAIDVEMGNVQFSSVGGVLLNAAQTAVILCPEHKDGGFAIPSSVTIINDGAFADCIRLTSVTIPEGVPRIGTGTFVSCSALTSVTIPSSVTYFGDGAFAGCGALTSVTIPAGVTYLAAVFLGDAPSSVSSTAFAGSAQEFTIYYLSGSAGFATPKWHFWAAFPLDEAPSPSQTWLLGHGYPLDTDLGSDPNGNGVRLLMAYALNLDPNQNLSGSLPVPITSADSLSISFYAAAEGITYSVQTSTDLGRWVTEGVTLSALDPDDRRTATVSRDSPRRFLRLVVAQL